jgi:hypothetical protein
MSLVDAEQTIFNIPVMSALQQISANRLESDYNRMLGSS